VAHRRDYRETAGVASARFIYQLGERARVGDIFAVAARDRDNLWLVLRVSHAESGFYVLVPHPDPTWDAHRSYHTNGRLHLKTHGIQPAGRLVPKDDKVAAEINQVRGRRSRSLEAAD
jgi:hypothetical protein